MEDTILEGLPDAVVASAQDGRIVFVNALAEELFGYPREELLGRPVQTLWPERVRERYIRNVQLCFQTEHPLRFTAEAYGLRRDGSEFIGEMSWGILHTDDGPLLLAIGRDISERLATEARLRALTAMGERALAGTGPVDLAAEAVAVICGTLPVTGAAVRLAGGSTLASGGLTAAVSVRVPVGDGGELLVASEGALGEAEMSLVRAVAGTLTTAMARLRGEDILRHDAVHDSMTGLANRALLQDRLEHALAGAARDGGDTGVLFVDLDHFKDINDVHGHLAGDAVLVEVAHRLRAAVRPADTVARFGGDEFVVICEHVDETATRALASRVDEAIRRPLAVGEVQHHLSASIGVAIGHDDADRLMAAADADAYRAKATRRSRVEL